MFQLSLVLIVHTHGGMARLSRPGSLMVCCYVMVCYGMFISLQSFDDELKQTAAAHADEVISGFPTFSVGKTNASLGYLAYNGLFAGWKYNTAGR